MSTLLYTYDSDHLKPTDTVDNAKSTVTTVTDDDASVAVSEPEHGRLETDARTDGGLTPHQVASKVNPVRRFLNPLMGAARGDHMQPVNDRQATVGTAAAREAAGKWGHGTAYSQQAITPVPDGTAFSEEYFVRDYRAPNEQVGDYMTANVNDPGTMDSISNAGKATSREPNTVNPYQQMYNAMMGLS